MDNTHISALEAKHAGLDTRIANELRRPQPDMAAVATLKKHKLKIKDAILAH